MDQQLQCRIIEEAYRAGMLNAAETLAVVRDGDQYVGERRLSEIRTSFSDQPLDCYSITARSAQLTRLLTPRRKTASP